MTSGAVIAMESIGIKEIEGIARATQEDVPALLSLWERSVRATHLFLAEADIAFFRPYVEKGLMEIEVVVIRNRDNGLAAFAGLGEDSVEMLFVDPGEQGKGYGTRLLEYAVYGRGIKKVDVNEQNAKALAFYRNMGFEVASRSETDAFGKPYPTLHLQTEVAPVLETSRLRLRPFRTNDVKAVFELCREPELGENAGWHPHRTEEESKAVLREVFMNKATVWAVERLSDGRLVGCVGLLPDSRRSNPEALMLGYWVGKPYWGNGYMKEAAGTVVEFAFARLDIRWLTACCYADNQRSQSVIRALGFEYEGTLHASALFPDGSPRQECLYYLPKY